MIGDKVHLIVACTRRKTVAPGETVFPDERDATRAYEVWLETLEKVGSESLFMTAGELYTGQHWSRATSVVARTGAELWVISAGLGFLHATDPVVPYEATFGAMPFSHCELWERLTTRPFTERRYASIAALMQVRHSDQFVVAASPVYIRAVERDLRKGRDALRNPDQLTIVTSKGYQGSLASSVKLADAGMMKSLNTNMVGLNICYALQILETL